MREEEGRSSEFGFAGGEGVGEFESWGPSRLTLLDELVLVLLPAFALFVVEIPFEADLKSSPVSSLCPLLELLDLPLANSPVKVAERRFLDLLCDRLERVEVVELFGDIVDESGALEDGTKSEAGVLPMR